MRKLFKKFIDSFRKDVSNRNYSGIIWNVVLAISILALVSVLLWGIAVIAGYLLDFLSAKFEIILFVSGSVVLVSKWINGKQQERKEVLAAQRSREQLESELAHQAIGESTYLTARQAMYSILTSVAPSCGLQTPEGLSSIEAPRHFISRDGILLFQFVAVKRGEINIRTITTLIETRIQQMANAHELNFEPSTLVVLGQVYSAIMVDQIHDYGSYVQIDVVFTTERYIKTRIERNHQNCKPPFTGGGNDDDF